jgi:hypothetical protein
MELVLRVAAGIVAGEIVLLIACHLWPGGMLDLAGVERWIYLNLWIRFILLALIPIVVVLALLRYAVTGD